MSSKSKMGTNLSTKLPNTPAYKRDRSEWKRTHRKPSFAKRVLGREVL